MKTNTEKWDKVTHICAKRMQAAFYGRPMQPILIRTTHPLTLSFLLFIITSSPLHSTSLFPPSGTATSIIRCSFLRWLVDSEQYNT